MKYGSTSKHLLEFFQVDVICNQRIPPTAAEALGTESAVATDAEATLRQMLLWNMRTFMVPAGQYGDQEDVHHFKSRILLTSGGIHHFKSRILLTSLPGG